MRPSPGRGALAGECVRWKRRRSTVPSPVFWTRTERWSPRREAFTGSTSVRLQLLHTHSNRLSRSRRTGSWCMWYVPGRRGLGGAGAGGGGDVEGDAGGGVAELEGVAVVAGHLGQRRGEEGPSSTGGAALPPPPPPLRGVGGPGGGDADGAVEADEDLDAVLGREPGRGDVADAGEEEDGEPRLLHPVHLARAGDLGELGLPEERGRTLEERGLGTKWTLPLTCCSTTAPTGGFSDSKKDVGQPKKAAPLKLVQVILLD